MRKRFKLLVATLAAFSLLAAACGDDGESGSGGESTTTVEGGASEGSGCPASRVAGDPDGTPVGLLFDLAGRGDQSFNDSAACGLDRAAQDLKINPSESVESTAGDRAERAKALSASNDLVIAVGFLWATPIEESATANPDTSYAILDAAVDLPNVYSISYAEEQGSFLVGAAAALQSKSKKIGFIGGVENDLIKKFQAGFEAGAAAADPSVEVTSEYISPDGDFSGFTAPDKGKVIADKMYADGIDIVYAAAGTSGAGMFEAAKEFSESGGEKVWGIGVDSDQYFTVGADLQEYVLTSMLKRVDVGVYESIKAFEDGTFKGGSSVELNLEKDGVGYSTTGDFLDGDTIDKLEDFKKDIVDGTISVPKTP